MRRGRAVIGIPVPHLSLFFPQHAEPGDLIARRVLGVGIGDDQQAAAA